MNYCKTIFFIPFVLFATINCISQIHPEHKRANVWYFGMNAGLDFNNNQITVLLDNNDWFDALFNVSTISDTAGNYLISASPTGVYDRNHQLLPHNAYCCSNYIYNGILLVPQPNNENFLYLFLSPLTYIEMDSCRFYRINLQLNNGLGDIDSVGPVLIADGGGSIIAMYHENLKDIWIISISYSNKEIKSWLLTEDGLNVQPACSYILQNSLKFLTGTDVVTFLRGSPLNNYILVDEGNNTDGEISQVLLLGFDNRTGCITNERILLIDTINNNDTSYMYIAPSFSPSGKSIYIPTGATSLNMPRGGYLFRIRNFENNPNFTLDTLFYFPYALTLVQSTPLGTMLGTGISNLPPYNGNPFYITEIFNPDSDNVTVLPYSFYLGGKMGGSSFINTIEHWFYRPQMNTINNEKTITNLIFPNPANEIIYFRIPENNFFIKITNTYGRCVYSGKINEYYLDISFLEKGIYIVEIFLKNDSQIKCKLVKL